MRSKAPAGFGGRLRGKGPSHVPNWDLAGQPILFTNRPKPPRSTFTPTWRSRNARSPASTRPEGTRPLQPPDTLIAYLKTL